MFTERLQHHPNHCSVGMFPSMATEGLRKIYKTDISGKESPHSEMFTCIALHEY